MVGEQASRWHSLCCHHWAFAAPVLLMFGIGWKVLVQVQGTLMEKDDVVPWQVW